MEEKNYAVIVKQTIQHSVLVMVKANDKDEAADLAVECVRATGIADRVMTHTNTDYDVQSVGTI